MIPAKRISAGALVLVCWLASQSAFSQTNAPAADTNQLEWLNVDEWVNDNFDPDFLRAVNGLDADRINVILDQLKSALAGTNVYQLGELRQAVSEWLPVLQKFEATAAYADWLANRLDYLRAAGQMEEQMHRAFPHAGKNLPALTLKFERQVWVRELGQRPPPTKAAGYLKELRAIFIAEHVPPELVWVAEVESGFNAKARSPAGAAGLFQLMPETARQENLSLWPWDQRFQPQKNAQAAARYLHALFRHYRDWPLTLAAYNVGPGRVDKLLVQHRAASFEGIMRFLPAETQMYVPKIEATIERREGKSWNDLKI